MLRRLCLVAVFAAALPLGVARAQVIPDEFGFLEQWEILSEEVRLGQRKLTDLGLPLGYDTEVSKASEEGLFRVSVSPETAPAPFNEIHTWLIRIETPEGAPVRGAEIKFYGGMPLHNHGFPTDPRIAGEVEPGTYAVEGIKFSMTGWWAMAMGIIAEEKSDRVSFNHLVEPWVD